MSVIRMAAVLRMMISAGEVSALPVGATWPAHQSVIWMNDQARKLGVLLPFIVSVRSDPATCVAVQGLDEALLLLSEEGVLAVEGSGYLAQWKVEPCAAPLARRQLLREDPALARLIVQAGQRLATLASTAVKNAETAALSWSSTVESGTPTDRQPPLVSL